MINFVILHVKITLLWSIGEIRKLPCIHTSNSIELYVRSIEYAEFNPCDLCSSSSYFPRSGTSGLGPYSRCWNDLKLHRHREPYACVQLAILQSHSRGDGRWSSSYLLLTAARDLHLHSLQYTGEEEQAVYRQGQDQRYEGTLKCTCSLYTLPLNQHLLMLSLRCLKQEILRRAQMTTMDIQGESNNGDFTAAALEMGMTFMTQQIFMRILLSGRIRSQLKTIYLIYFVW